MGRGDKKGPASTPPAPSTERPPPAAASAPATPNSAPTPSPAATPGPAATQSPAKPAPTPGEGVSIPRTTTDDPWRDLHPTRVWPD